MTTVAHVPLPLPNRSIRAALAPVVSIGLLAACAPSPDEVDSGRIHLSIGDSYAAGFRPAIGGEPAENVDDGFAWIVASQAGLTLESLACSGITAADYVDGQPCRDGARAPGMPDRDSGSELDAVVDFLDDHGDDVELVTVILGGNDVLPCAAEKDWRSCAEPAAERVQQALDRLLEAIVARVDHGVPVIGLTYPNILLADGPRGRADAQPEASIALFGEVFNPALEQVYAKHGARFVDVTAAADGYRRSGKTQVCELTYYCDLGDVHPNERGHERLAELVLDAREEIS